MIGIDFSFLLDPAELFQSALLHIEALAPLSTALGVEGLGSRCWSDREPKQ